MFLFGGVWDWGFLVPFSCSRFCFPDSWVSLTPHIRHEDPNKGSNPNLGGCNRNPGGDCWPLKGCHTWWMIVISWLKFRVQYVNIYELRILWWTWHDVSVNHEYIDLYIYHIIFIYDSNMIYQHISTVQGLGDVAVFHHLPISGLCKVYLFASSFTKSDSKFDTLW